MRVRRSHPGSGSGGVTGTMIDVTDLRQAERMKREFTATVSHELRTPLTSIAGAIGLLNGGAAGPLPEAARNLVAIADKNAQRLRVLIDDLLDMEKLLAGKLPFAFEDLELRPLLEQALNEHQPFADTHGVRLTLADRADHARVHTDPGRFQQVLSNLLSNAVKFSPEGGEVLVTATAVAQAVRIEVRDRGPGIDPEFHPQIFQKFAQADASDTRRRGGTGLGLAITRELVEQMHGRIGFDSSPGDGATFWFELPVPSSKVA
jgi:signal transduction histidine kinase